MEDAEQLFSPNLATWRRAPSSALRSPSSPSFSAAGLPARFLALLASSDAPRSATTRPAALRCAGTNYALNHIIQHLSITCPFCLNHEVFKSSHKSGAAPPTKETGRWCSSDSAQLHLMPARLPPTRAELGMWRAALVVVARAAAAERPLPRLPALRTGPSWLSSVQGRKGLTRGEHEGGAAARLGDAQPYDRGGARAANSGPVGVVGLSHVQRRAVGISPQSCSVVSLAFFSSGGRGTDYRLLNRSISASTDLRAILKVVRDSHQDFQPRDASLACHRLAKHAGKKGQTIKSDEDVLTFRLATKAAVRQASRMKPQEISNTLFAIAKLAERGVEVDAAAVQAVSREAPRVAGEMNPQEVSNTWSAMAKLAERRVEVDAAVVLAVSKRALCVSGEMIPQAVSNTLWAMAKLAERSVEVDAAAVRAVSREAPRVAGEMKPQEISNTLWAMARLTERGVDAATVRAVSREVPRVAGEMSPQHVFNTLWAVARLAERGVEVDAAAVRAVSSEAPRVANEMVAQHVSHMLWAIGKLAEMGVEVDVAAVWAVSKEAPRVASKMSPRDLALIFWSWAQLLESGHPIRSLCDEAALFSTKARWTEVLSLINTQDKGMTEWALTVIETAEKEAA